jgi:hypothetical protein
VAPEQVIEPETPCVEQSIYDNTPGGDTNTTTLYSLLYRVTTGCVYEYILRRFKKQSASRSSHDLLISIQKRMPGGTSQRLLRRRRRLDHGRLGDDDLRLRHLLSSSAALLHLRHLQLSNTSGHLRLPLPRGAQFGAFLVYHLVLSRLAHAVTDGIHGREAEVQRYFFLWGVFLYAFVGCDCNGKIIIITSIFRRIAKMMGMERAATMS